MIKLTDILNEDENPCWKGYKQIGMKKKGGKEVPNCVPESVVKEESLNEASLKQMHKLPNVKAGVKNYKAIISQFHDQGIGITAGFIFGDDLDTKDVFEKTSEFILRSKIDAAQLTLLNPLPTSIKRN